MLSCSTCLKYTKENAKETLIAKEVSYRLWKTLDTDLFLLNEKNYLIVINYSNKLVEIRLLQNVKSTSAIKLLKFMFARCRIPELL